jgi:malate dehydrogenase (oxaloacetate-decarboxylating)
MTRGTSRQTTRAPTWKENEIRSSWMPMSKSARPCIYTNLFGYELLNNPRLNKGTAFTEAERDRFELHGLLPPHIGTLKDQMQRRKKALREQVSNFGKYSFMRDLQDTNETLFYALTRHNVEEMMPIVYTPAVGEGCQRFSEIWRKPRGLFISYPNKDRIDQIFSHSRYDQVKCIVVSDGERILGLGDQGAGGMGIPIGKMALYTALAGIHPEYCLPVLLDVGTDNEERLRDPIYIGWRHQRVRGQDYDAFVERFVSAVKRRWPRVLLQWEDFAGSNAARLLGRYREQLCTFNDDIQGTAAVATAAILSAVRITGVPLKEQTIAIYGFGSAGVGIANLLLKAMTEDGLSPAEARKHFYAIDLCGLLVEGMKDIRPDQKSFIRKRAEIEQWELPETGFIGLREVVANAKPTILIGVSGQAGGFTEDAVRTMARFASQPIILPLSNPASRSEASPQQLLDWTEGRALIGTGSPSDSVRFRNREVRVAQVNNSYIFPGLALGVVASGAKRVSDGMIMSAARALARLCPAMADKKSDLLPALRKSREVSRVVAQSVGRQSLAEGLARVAEEETLAAELAANIWQPVYLRYKRTN